MTGLPLHHRHAREKLGTVTATDEKAEQSIETVVRSLAKAVYRSHASHIRCNGKQVEQAAQASRCAGVKLA